jgi:hypothetical protein
MNLGTLRTEFLARGFDFEAQGGNTRPNYFLNRAYQDICGQEDWPFLEATASGTTPLSIPDLRTIESVIDTTQLVKLTPLDRRFITDTSTNLSTVGAPCFYYTTATTTVNVYPTSTTDSISVRYYKVPSDLSADGDTPLVPARFHISAIVDLACVYAYQDSDNFDAANVLYQQVQGVWNEMRDQLLNQQHDQPDDFIVVTDASIW